MLLRGGSVGRYPSGVGSVVDDAEQLANDVYKVYKHKRNDNLNHGGSNDQESDHEKRLHKLDDVMERVGVNGRTRRVLFLHTRRVWI